MWRRISAAVSRPTSEGTRFATGCVMTGLESSRARMSPYLVPDGHVSQREARIEAGRACEQACLPVRQLPAGVPPRTQLHCRWQPSVM
ncbi:unnamed protein product [Ixodes pacificus]